MLKLLRYIKKFIALPWSEKWTFLEALILLGLAKLMLTFFPFRICIKTLKTGKKQTNINIEKLKKIKYAVGRANRLAIWKNVCLVQSFAARWMLMRRGIHSKLFIGVTQDKHKKLTAHAWLKVNDFEIVSQNGNYKQMFSI